MEERLQDRGDPDRIRRPDRRDQQDVESHRPRGGLDGLAPSPHGHPRKALMSSYTGREFVKMSGSGNDFVMVDARKKAPGELADPKVVSRICARATGIGADGVVFLEPS